jgi:hypothetical protein
MQRIPTSFNEFTVKQFQEWQKVTAKSFDDVLDKELALLSIAANMAVEEVWALTGDQLKPLIAKLNTLAYSKPNEKVKKFIFVNHKAYQAIIKPSELKDLLNTSQYTAFKEYTKKDCIENMHLILPLLYCPCKFLRKKRIADNTQALSREFLEAKIGDVYGAVFFYSIVWEKLNEASLPYLKKAKETLEAHMEEVIKALEEGSEMHTAGTI